MRKINIFIIIYVISIYCAAKPISNFSISNTPKQPDYSKEYNWSALPFRKDAADLIPKQEAWIDDAEKKVDVFYIYPTIFTKGNTWNADIENKKLNKKIDKLPVKYQASIFNQVGRVYAPRYRQAILESYFDTTENKKFAFELAYQDIKEAFEYYLKYYNNGRPIIIASHSQGSTHSKRLIKDFFDTEEQKKKLVAAYIIGIDVYKEDYNILIPCASENEINCYITWASYKEGSTGIGKSNIRLYGNVCVNPISWKMDTEKAKSQNGVLLNINRRKKFESEVYIKNNFLHVKTNMIFFKKKNELHLVDMNLFWYDIRENIKNRVDNYFKINKL
jgi:hypothetical protein